MKLLTVTVPCYNSEAYMDRCLRSVVEGGEELDVLIVDDGSRDRTGEIADRWAREYPGIVRVIHQENGGHGEGLNQGIRTAQGLFFKTVDSDDRLDPDSLKELLDALRRFAQEGDLPDLIVNDYVYDRTEQEACFSVSFDTVFHPGRMETWESCRAFPIWKQFMIHSLCYRTQVLRDMGLELPRHVFYEDNLYIYRPLPYTRKIYYLHRPLYGYFIGREDQSVNDEVILRRLDQVTRIAGDMICSYPLSFLEQQPRKLKQYMISNLAGQLFTTCALQFMKGEEGLKMYREMWERIRSFDEPLYHRLRRHPVGMTTVLPGRLGRAALVGMYRFGRRMIHF